MRRNRTIVMTMSVLPHPVILQVSKSDVALAVSSRDFRGQIVCKLKL